MIADTSLEERLQKLPRKVAVPLKEILATGHIDRDLLATALDAGELSGESHRLLGFTVGLVYLQSKHVPVVDAIRMARAQGRRIHLNWSAKRWEQEHNRLARQETLWRLTEENAHYDVSKYLAYLPAAFPGYLIRTSRRLGMEGLRQRHCVASYHQKVLAGYSAIAVVFLERQRWTVQIALTGKRNAPLRIQQIQSRFGRLPTPAVCNAIASLLLPASGHQEDAEKEDSAERPAWLDTLRRVLPVLREREVRQVTVSFDGCGDSGSVDGVEYGDTAIEGEAIDVELPAANVEWQGAEPPADSQLRWIPLNEAITQLTYDYLEETAVNWYDNDGGFGELKIDVQAGTVSLEINVRTSDASCEYERCLDIDSGEEVEV